MITGMITDTEWPLARWASVKRSYARASALVTRSASLSPIGMWAPKTTPLHTRLLVLLASRPSFQYSSASPG